MAADEALLAFGPPLAGAGAMFQLSAAEDLVGGRGQSVRRAAGAGAAGGAARLQRIAVMPVPESGLGLAINDRLQRAAAPR